MQSDDTHQRLLPPVVEEIDPHTNMIGEEYPVQSINSTQGTELPRKKPRVRDKAERRSIISKWAQEFKRARSQEEAARYAALLISDALHGRNFGHRVDFNAMRINDVIRSKWYSFLFGLTVAVEMALAIVEQPSSLRGPPEGFEHLNEALLAPEYTTLIELCCLGLLGIDVVLRFHYLGWGRFKKSSWALFKTIFVGIALFNTVISLGAPVIPRLHRVLRPVMFAAHFRNVSKIFGNLLMSIPRITNVFLLVLFHVFFFGVFAHILFGGIDDQSCSRGPPATCEENPRLLCSPFDKCCTDYFGTFLGSLNQLFILLTTANYPDVMMPVYDCHPWSALFFVAFLTIGLYFIMNIVLAVVYGVFQDMTRVTVLNTVTKRVEALDAAYDMIASSDYFTTHKESEGIPTQEHDNENQSKRSLFSTNEDRKRNTPAVTYNLQKSNEVGRVGLKTWYELMSYLRPDLKDIQKEVLFHALDEDRRDALSKEEFREVTNFIEVEFHSPFRGQKKDYQCFNGEYALRVRNLLWRYTNRRLFKYIDGFLLFAYCVFIVFDLSYKGHLALKIGLEIFTWLFLAITVLKYLGLGYKKFTRDKYNILDSIALPLAGIGYITGMPILQSLTFVRSLRVIKAAEQLEEFGKVIRTSTRISVTFLRYIAVIFLVYYMWAIVGMELFAGTIHYKPQSHAPFFEGNATLDSKLKCTAYYGSKYWFNNFNHLWTALVTLFEQMVVNNWAIVMMGYAYATNLWAMLYFYLWYFIMVIVVLNIVTAFLLEDFMLMSAKIKDEDDGIREKWVEKIETALDLLGIPRNKWVITRKAHPLHLYEMMFANDIHQCLEENWEDSFHDDRTRSRTTSGDTSGPYAEGKLQGNHPHRQSHMQLVSGRRRTVSNAGPTEQSLLIDTTG
eukprot:gb/GECG01002690.1/.p1 GENE.gb/GECG01002690.1/~~gb/GECG01002690.1/.p1  ORF type:complete len:899 (+),score=70.31 gb/GECG01002690.1/:1-2697(+)